MGERREDEWVHLCYRAGQGFKSSTVFSEMILALSPAYPGISGTVWRMVRRRQAQEQ